MFCDFYIGGRAMKNLVLIIIFLALIVGGCSKDYNWKNPNDPVNNLPPLLIQTMPSDGDSGWSGYAVIAICSVKDPNANDTLIYCDLFWGTTNPPQYYSRLYGYNVYQPEEFQFSALDTLQANKTYYWKVSVYDNHSAITQSPVYCYHIRP